MIFKNLDSAGLSLSSCWDKSRSCRATSAEPDKQKLLYQYLKNFYIYINKKKKKNNRSDTNKTNTFLTKLRFNSMLNKKIKQRRQKQQRGHNREMRSRPTWKSLLPSSMLVGKVTWVLLSFFFKCWLFFCHNKQYQMYLFHIWSCRLQILFIKWPKPLCSKSLPMFYLQNSEGVVQCVLHHT